MNKVDIFIGIKIAIATIGGIVADFLGGWDALIFALVVFVIADYITGITKAMMGKSDKTEKGGVSSNAMWRGGIRKILIFIVVAIACVADKILMPNNEVVRNIVIMYYISTEGVSILENIALCGVPFPDKLKEILENLKNDKEDKT